MRLLPIAMMLFALGTQSALASSTLTCTIDDKAIDFSFQSSVGQSASQSIGAVNASWTLKRNLLPTTLAAETLDPAALVHHWLAGNRVDLHLTSERAVNDTFVSIELLIRTAKLPKSDFEYKGSYDLTVAYVSGKGVAEKKTVLKGKVDCGLG